MAATLACLEVPALQGWPRCQAYLVDAIKRAALRQLHASPAGERLLLRMYLTGEEATELALQSQSVGEQPDWLVRQMAQHLTDERHHASVLSAALAERDEPPTRYAPDWLSRRKIAQWNQLATRYASQFSQGVVVPAFAIGLCAEQMATRVLQRHCQVIGSHHPLHALLAGILDDEARHVRLCRHTLERLVQQGEHQVLGELLHDIRTVDRAYGVTSAVCMYAAGLVLRAAHVLRRCSRWRPVSA